MSRSAALLLFAIAVPAFGQAAKPERTLTGVWELKSVEIEGKPAPEKALPGLLKELGGVEIGMLYKFRKPTGEDPDADCVLNDFEAGYIYSSDIKDLLILSGVDGKPKKKFRFVVDFVGKNIRLRFKEKQKAVSMTFAPDA
jgi:hypothetical protein